MRVALFASDDFAIPLCQALIEAGMLACLVTQPDKPAGRGLKVQASPIRKLVEDAHIPVFAPESPKSKEFKAEFLELKIDIPIIIAYGEFIPSWIRDWKAYPCVNVHPSLLPRWRGADPIRAALLVGDSKTGVTIHYTEKELDAGDILARFETKILPDETYGQLKSFLSLATVGLVKNFLTRLKEMSIRALAGFEDYPSKEAISFIFKSTKQDPKKVTHSKKIDKKDWIIDWNKDAIEVHNLIRALSPDPGARTGPADKPLFIFRTSMFPDIDGQPGHVVKANREGLWVACGKGSISIISLQPSGKRIMNAADFINGYRPKPGRPLIDSK